MNQVIIFTALIVVVIAQSALSATNKQENVGDLSNRFRDDNEPFQPPAGTPFIANRGSTSRRPNRNNNNKNGVFLATKFNGPDDADDNAKVDVVNVEEPSPSRTQGSRTRFAGSLP